MLQTLADQNNDLRTSKTELERVQQRYFQMLRHDQNELLLKYGEEVEGLKQEVANTEAIIESHRNDYIMLRKILID